MKVAVKAPLSHRRHGNGRMDPRAPQPPPGKPALVIRLLPRKGVYLTSGFRQKAEKRCFLRGDLGMGRVVRRAERLVFIFLACFPILQAVTPAYSEVNQQKLSVDKPQ